jgi:hypothetical protein
MNHSFGAAFATFLISRDLQRATRESSGDQWCTHRRPHCEPRVVSGDYRTIATARLLKAAFP